MHALIQVMWGHILDGYRLEVILRIGGYNFYESGKSWYRNNGSHRSDEHWSIGSELELYGTLSCGHYVSQTWSKWQAASGSNGQLMIRATDYQIEHDCRSYGWK